ncbi:MAG: hypothetical protein ACLGSH_08955 [Acidobacteriota bacterium]
MMIDFTATMLQQGRIVIPFPSYSENVSIWHQISDALHVSIYRVLSLLIAVLPGILAFFVALAIFAVIGKVISVVLRWLLKAFDFDARMARGGEWTSSSSPTALVARITFWLFVLLGLLIGVSAFDTSYAVGTALSFSLLPYLTHGVGAILILIVGTLIARFLARSVLIGAVNAQLQYARFLSLGVKWLVLVLTAAMALEHLEIGGAIVDLAFSILFGGIVLTLSLAVGLGSRDLVSRSLESQLDRGERGVPPAAAPQPPPAETIRHF